MVKHEQHGDLIKEITSRGNMAVPLFLTVPEGLAEGDTWQEKVSPPEMDELSTHDMGLDDL